MIKKILITGLLVLPLCLFSQDEIDSHKLQEELNALESKEVSVGLPVQEKEVVSDEVLIRRSAITRSPAIIPEEKDLPDEIVVHDKKLVRSR